jgi:hypothetical protein
VNRDAGSGRTHGTRRVSHLHCCGIGAEQDLTVMTVRPGIRCYIGSAHQIRWAGVRLTADVLDDLSSGPLSERVHDALSDQAILDELQALSSTEMSATTIAALFVPVTDPTPWEVSESLAEVLLAEWHSVIWAWNMVRDRRVRRASLPGADLIGFSLSDGSPMLLLGEVKSSSDEDSPPGVVYGRTGMIYQLETLCAGSGEDRLTLIRWLRTRCNSPELVGLYQAAMTRYVESGGHGLILVGCLIRDTVPLESDLQSRGRALATTVSAPMRVDLHAWYLPMALDELPLHALVTPHA